MPREYKMYINGEWVDALDGAMYDDYNPYTGEVFARVPSGKRGDARRAIEAAAFPAWSQTLPAERQALFLKAADILQKKPGRDCYDSRRGNRLHLRLCDVSDHVHSRPAA
jgi:aldehyde dehydrogenase (NAD+)